MEARASAAFVGRARELEELERALDAARRGQRRDRPRRRRGGHRQDAAGVELATRAREAGFEVLVGRSIDLVGTELPYQPFVEALRPLGELAARRRLAAAGVRGGARAARRPGGRRAGAARARGPALGRHVDARSRRLPRPQPRATGGCCCSRPIARDEPRRRSGCAGSPTASGARARRSCSSSGRSSATSWRRCSRRTTPAGGADRRDRRPLRGQPVLRRGAPRRRRRASGELPRGLRDAAAAARGRARRPDAEPAAPGRGRRARRRLPAARAVAALPEREVRESLRAAVEHGVLVADQATGSFRFRHALLAEAIYATILPGEREELHARLADELARSAPRRPPSSRRTGRRRVAAPRRSPRRSRRRARRRRSSAWPRRSRTSSGRSRCGPPCRTRPSSRARPRRALLLGGRAGQPDGRGAARGRARASGRSSSSARATRCAPRSCTSASAAPARERRRPTPPSPRSSAPSSSCRRSRPRRSARRRWRRSGTG